jgi:hypothetical protein
MGGSPRLIVLALFFLSLLHLGGQDVYCQTSGSVGKNLPVRIGAIDFRIKEFEATPSSIRMLEVQIEVVNESEKVTIPPNAVKIVATPKEIESSSPGSKGDFAPPPGEMTLTLSLPPRGIRIGIIGFSLPQEKLQAISFEIQINPPEGEKKTVTFHF